jgi:protein required for attachment to host cells
MDENPPTREQGTDRPGRAFKRAGTNLRSGMDTKDWHQLEEHRFAQRVAAAMEQLVRARDAKTLVVVAPPRTLADLRHAFHADVKKRIVAEASVSLGGPMISETPTMHIGENSPEEVALKLLRYSASVERKVLHTTTPGSGEIPADRKWILDTYAEYLKAVRNPGNRGQH